MKSKPASRIKRMLIGRTSWPPDARRFGARIVRGHLLTMIPDPVTQETVPTAFRIRPAVEGLSYPDHR